jgi:digeranylgeranylglycerophospholipid reductase
MRAERFGLGVAIIGAGPAGLQTAIRLRELGLSPILFEEHAAVGVHKLCAGLISRKGAEDLGLVLDGALQQEIRGARLYSPNGTMLQVSRAGPVAYVMDRKAFDQGLQRKARRLGVPVVTNAHLCGIERGCLHVREKGRSLRLLSEFVVGADGASSLTRQSLGLDPAGRGVIHSAQALCAGSFDPDFAEVHLGGFARGFFAWVIPTGTDSAKVGLARTDGADCAAALRAFIASRASIGAVQRLISGVIPFGPPLPAVQAGNAALVGDAAFHTKATSGGGIVYGMKAANLLAASIAAAAGRDGNDGRDGGPSLRSYERGLAGINRELRMHWKIRSWYNGLTEPHVDAIFALLKRRGIEGFLADRGDMDAPSAFVARLAIKPSYWFMARALAGIALA